jgi:hypothetical protein
MVTTTIVDFSDVVEHFTGQKGVTPVFFVTNYPVNLRHAVPMASFTKGHGGEYTATVYIVPNNSTDNDIKVLEITIDKNSDYRDVHEYIKAKLIAPYKDIQRKIRVYGLQPRMDSSSSGSE